MGVVIVVSNIVPSAPADAEPTRWARLAVDPPELFWRSLRYFSFYRLGVAALFLGLILLFGPALNFGYQNPGRFAQVCAAYLAAGVLFHVMLNRYQHQFSLQLTLQVLVDITLLTLLLHFSGGARSGMAFMLLVVLAAAGLVGQGRLSLFFAAVATLAVLLEQTVRVFELGGDVANYAQSGIISIGFFATAISAHFLARRVVANEVLARQHGAELALQRAINERVIRDMQDGVLVVDAAGQVRQSNPQARRLLDVGEAVLAGRPLAALVPLLADGFARWAQAEGEVRTTLTLPASGRELQVRFLPAREGGYALIFLEDMQRIQEEARQIKLAALGRLTANMAHEIRNPLASISHAAELLADEQREATRVRLTRIIGDNTQRLNRLVAEVLELGRRDRAYPEWIDLKAYLDRFLEDYAINDPRIAQAVGLTVEAPEYAMTPLALWFDRGHLNRVLWNLLGNAMRHGGGGPDSVRIELRRGGSGTELHVIDTGEGIEVTSQAHLFEPFFTTHGAGTGLGLYIARELCEANEAQLVYCGNAPGAHFCIMGRADAGACDVVEGEEKRGENRA